MNLPALGREGLLAPQVPTDYSSIRRVFRTYFPHTNQGTVPLAVPRVVAALSHQTLQAQLVRLSAGSWRAFLGDEFAAGRSVVVIVHWSLLAGHWSPKGVTHAVIVTGPSDLAAASRRVRSGIALLRRAPMAAVFASSMEVAR